MSPTPTLQSDQPLSERDGIARKTATSFATAPTRRISAGGISFAYRELGVPNGRPLVMLNHWGAVLDNFDPRLMDGFARTHRVVAVDYRGIGGSSGSAPLTIDEMARDTIALVQALGLAHVDLMGFSLGGFVAQAVVLQAPHLVRRLILTGTGPAGGAGIERVGAVSWPLIVKGVLTRRDPKTYLFFTSTANGRAAADAFLARLNERTTDRDKAPTPRAFLRQLAAIHHWGRQTPHNLTRLQLPVLIANGDHDIMVPTALSHDMARRIPGAELVIYNDAGHGGIFQYHEDFLARASAFLAA